MTLRMTHSFLGLIASEAASLICTMSQPERDLFDDPVQQDDLHVFQDDEDQMNQNQFDEDADNYNESPYAHEDFPPTTEYQDGTQMYQDDGIRHVYRDDDAEYVGDMNTFPKDERKRRKLGWGMFEGFRDDPNIFGFEDDEETRRFGEWDEPEYDQEPRPEEDPEERKRRRELCCWILLCLCCCCLILVLLLGGIGAIWYGLKNEDDSPPYVPEVADDDWEMSRPYLGIRTTPMNEYPADCVYDDNDFPHVLTQCDCAGRITKIPSDTLALYHEVREDITEKIYYGNYNLPSDSCEPPNKALLWLASGDTRDAGDLYQRYVLATQYFGLNGTKWDLSNLWMSNNNECLWLGTRCNTNYRITSIEMDTNNVHGAIPTELSHLGGLRVLSITKNHLTGTIPPHIITMPRLEILQLYANQLRGSIPPEIGHSSTLRRLRLENNLLFGTLVTDIGKVTTLEMVGIGFNQFWRYIPTELGLLTNLKWLNMEDNRFSGTLPTFMGRLSHMEYWLLNQNLMTGPLPTELASMSNLEEFRFVKTGLGGIFPTIFGEAWPKMKRLELASNNFVGTIMTQFGNMTDLQWLSLNDNDLTGPIPTEFGNLANMTRLSLQDTLITGQLPTELGLMTKLQNFALEFNGLTGAVPQEVCTLRSLNLDMLVTTCPSPSGAGLECDVPTCCTFCRRGNS